MVRSRIGSASKPIEETVRTARDSSAREVDSRGIDQIVPEFTELVNSRKEKDSEAAQSSRNSGAVGHAIDGGTGESVGVRIA